MQYRIRFRRSGGQQAEETVEAHSPQEAMVKFRHACDNDDPTGRAPATITATTAGSSRAPRRHRTFIALLSLRRDPARRGLRPSPRPRVYPFDDSAARPMPRARRSPGSAARYTPEGGWWSARPLAFA